MKLTVDEAIKEVLHIFDIEGIKLTEQEKEDFSRDAYDNSRTCDEKVADVIKRFMKEMAL